MTITDYCRLFETRVINYKQLKLPHPCLVIQTFEIVLFQSPLLALLSVTIVQGVSNTKQINCKYKMICIWYRVRHQSIHTSADHNREDLFWIDWVGLMRMWYFKVSITITCCITREIGISQMTEAQRVDINCQLYYHIFPLICYNIKTMNMYCFLKEYQKQHSIKTGWPIVMMIPLKTIPCSKAEERFHIYPESLTLKCVLYIIMCYCYKKK